MDNELIQEILDYIEEKEFAIEHEWGYCRKLETLIENHEMPEIYYKLKELQ